MLPPPIPQKVRSNLNLDSPTQTLRLARYSTISPLAPFYQERHFSGLSMIKNAIQKTPCSAKKHHYVRSVRVVCGEVETTGSFGSSAIQ